jgi:predicted O-linked N-acetylglucosamine transferase (SPINDLY family)
MYLAAGNLDDAIEAYRQAIFLQPDYAHARSNLGNALRDAGRLDEALEAHRQAVASAPANPEIRSNMILGLYYSANADVQTILGESRRWNLVHAEPLRVLVRPSGNDPSPERRLRVGFVLPDLRIHSVGCFLMPLLEARDRQNFHVTCYAMNAKVDAKSDRLRAYSDNCTSGLSDAAAQRSATIIDILVDLSAHTAGNRLLVFQSLHRCR